MANATKRVSIARQRTGIQTRREGCALVVRDRDVQVIVVQILVGEINRARFVDRHARISLADEATCAVRNSANRPRDSGIFRHHHVDQTVAENRRIETASLVRHIHCAIGRDFGMPM